MLRPIPVAVVLVALAASIGLAITDDHATGPGLPLAPAAEQGSETGPSTDGEHDVLILDASMIPGGTGWILAPIESDESGPLHVDIEVRLRNTEDRLKVVVPIVANQGDVRAAMFLEPWTKDVTVRGQGQRVACCTDTYDGEPGDGGWSGWYGTSPEAPLFVGLVASGLGPSDSVEMRVTSQGADIWKGVEEAGSDALALDLFEEAAAQEPGIRLRGADLVGGPTDVHVDWTASQGVFMVVDWDLRDARGELRATLPGRNDTSIPYADSTRGELVASSPAGGARLSFLDPGREGDVREDQPAGQAVALFADLPLPYHQATVVQRFAG